MNFFNLGRIYLPLECNSLAHEEKQVNSSMYSIQIQLTFQCDRWTQINIEAHKHEYKLTNCSPVARDLPTVIDLQAKIVYMST